jgi:hypothetical protein
MMAVLDNPLKSLSVELLILDFITTLSSTRLMQFVTTCSQEFEKLPVWAHLQYSLHY